MIKRFYILLLAIVASVGMSYALTPLSGDTWDDNTKTLTVNSNPGYEAYYQNTQIEHLIISDGVTTIGESAFDECTALLSVVIGNDVTNIEAYAFDECGAMTSLTIGNKVQTIGESAFGSCESLTSVIIPNSVTSIGNSAFNTCDQMSSLTIGSSVQTIGESAFKNCSMLTDVTIPASVESIGAWFFRNCENLATITCEATTPPTLGNNAFFDCDKLAHIYVPAASVATYKAAVNWSTKEAIISAIPTNQLYMEVDGTAGTLKWGLAGSNPAYDGDAIQYSDRKYITTLTIDESCQNHTLTSFYNLFHIFKALTTINGIENLATANVENMSYMFYDCQSLTSLDLSSFNTAKVTNMKGMFNGCSNLTTIYVGDDWNTSAVTNGGAMFYGCTKLPNYDSEATGVEKAYVGAGGYLSAMLTPADVMALISAIGEVEYTAESKAKIDAARAAYNGLSNEDKALVTNYSTLTAAEQAYQAFIQAAAAPVIAQIEALPTTIKLSTYFSTYDLMVAARAAYNALSAEVQAAVTNLSKLTDLEAAFAAIGGVNEKLSKPFSVGEGQVVYFSHGNLQATYNGTNWSWAFAAHQYDYIGDTSGNIIINGNGTLSGAGTVDLFGWVANSSTVLTSGVAKYGVSNSEDVSDYGLGTTETLKGDWGVAANDANIGGYNDWRILSNDEWVYLFKTRTDAASKYGYATVDNKNGVIIIPDAFTDPMKNKGNKAFIPQNVDKGYSTNVYTSGGDWEAMEAAGAVFMPAAGRRAGTAVTINEGTGFYWSSTPMSYQASYFMGFMGSNVVPNNDRYRYHGLSVRLVSNNAPVAVSVLDHALAAVDLINAIPTPVTLDEACVKAIKDAREAVTALGENANLIDETDMAKLTKAEADYTNLIKAEADKVVAKINNIPTPIELKLATRDSIESARAAYDALNADQKALVPAAEYQKLTDAEAELATLNPGGGAPLPEGALTGAFSINADGSKIAFSKGNLQATYGGSDWTWAFAAHQYDVIGNAVANTAITGSGTVSANGTVDLFGWSTAATYYGINNTNVSGKHPGDFIDWGETIAEGWRTLTRDEWGYLFETRTDAASKYGHATVAGIHGIIVLPDSYKGTAINADHSDWSNNIISAEDWAAYEANGVAFLPAAGSRLATSVNYVGEYAFYWTSTTYGEKWAYRVRFVPNLSPDYGDRVPGQSVRLVTAHTGSPTPLDSAQAVKDLIEAIPMPVTLEDACVNAVQAARDAYNALAEATKGALDDATVQKLNQAIADYTALIQAGADEVIAKINNIPQPVTLKLATRDSIQNARAAYDALTADQKALVTNYDVLTAAEEALAGLNPGGGMPAGALNGKFSINADGDQIAFSKGNLQATTEDLGEHWTWGFAANQWNYLGIAVANSKINGNGTVSENGTVDLFGWSTAATYYGINNSYKAVDYIGDFVDWGPNMGAGWRTLTKDEWNYLIENNTKGRATVNDKNGYIFLPDNWSGPAFTPDPDNFTTNVYSGDDWTAMENAGAVFLPSGPARNGTYALIANDAKYCSSTSLNNDTSYVFTIYYNQSQSACTGTNRAYGCMVRLVTEGGGATPLDSAQHVKDLIEAIPMPVTLEDACVKAIEDARAAYDALSEAAQGALDAATVQKLTDAGAALTALNQAVADEVIAKINNIPTPVELKLATRDSIQNARTAYDALNAAQQALVSNYQTLLDAETALAELNKGGSTPVDIVWDGNTGIENVSPTTTSPAYEGMTVTVGQGSSFSTYQSRLYFTFYSQPNGGFIFANENGTNITKVVIESTTALTSTMTEVDRMGSGWVISNENKTATWTGNTDSVSIWKGQSFTNYWVVDMITFTVNGSSTPLDSAQAVKDLIDAIPTPVEYPTSGPAIAAALVAYNQLSDAAKGALDAADVQKMTDAAAQYAALDAIAAIEAIPAEIVYDPAVKAAIETAREKYDALIDASKALVDAEVVAKLTNAEQAWADLVALIEHTVTYIGKDGELKNEKVALLHIPNPAPDFNGHKFVRWDVKAGDFLEEGLRIKAVYTPIITTNPAAYDTLVYNGTAQTLIEAGVASDGHIEYRLNEGDWSAELPKADMAAAYVVDYKLVCEGHEDYMAGSVTAVIAKAPVTYVAPQAYDTLAYNYNAQVLVTAGQTNDGTIQYSLDPNMLDSWSTDLPQAMNAGTYAVYFRVQGDLNHFDSIAPAPVAVTIAKRDIEVTAPVAYDTLVYNTLAQTLAAAGSADFSTMEYTLTPDNGEGWSADMPQAVDAGAYAIYYRVQGDNNHNDYPAHSIAATIAQAPLTITAENKEVIYGESAPEFTVTFNGWMGQDDATVISNLQITSTYAAGSSVGTYAIVPSGATALNYTMSYVNGSLTVNKAKVSVINAEAQKAKFADGHAVAVVLNQGTLDGIKLNDAVTHVTTATFSSAEVAENLTITLFYELQGDEALLANYLLEPTSEIFSEEGVIIEPFLPDNEGKPEDEEAKIQEGIEVYAYGYCTGTGYSLNYHLNSGNPDQYKIEFENSHFDDVAYEETKIAGSDGQIDIEIPDGLPTGNYKMSVTFRDSRFPWLESKAFDVTFHVNLPETYVKPLFNNTIILVDTCECMTDIQWYHRADTTKTWQPVAGATGHYLHVDGQLTGEYFVKAKMNGVETYTCEQTDMQTLYGAETNKQAKVKAYPNPVNDNTNVTIEGSEEWVHNLRIVNLMGVEMNSTTFEGDHTVVEMSGYPQGNYMISVDGIMVKVLKQ